MNKKLRKQGGFTLAELLIVVAIIGVLVAISIPIFGPRLEGSRESTDAANLRSAYAAATAAVLAGKVDSATNPEGETLNAGMTNLIYTKDGTLSTTLTDANAMKGKSTQNGWQGTNMTNDLPSAITFNGNSGRKGIYVQVNTDDNTVKVQFGAFGASAGS